jgi:signal transduction histidine kinase
MVRELPRLAAVQDVYLDAILRGCRDRAAQVILEALDRGVDLRDVYLEVLRPAQQRLGALWHDGVVDVGTEHLATAVTQWVMSLLYPRLFATRRIGRRLVGACVAGELHELGVRMLCDFFELEGWDTFYLGANVPADSVAENVLSRRADALALSATVNRDVEVVRDVIRRVRARPGGNGVCILVGGPALASADLCREVGADGFALDARAGVERAHALLSIPRAERGAASLPPPPPQPARAGRGPDASALDDPRRRDVLAELSTLYSEHVNSQRELAKYRIDLARLAAEKNELVGMLAHDLRNPLSVVLSYCGLLRDPEVGAEERSEILGDVEGSMRFVLSLVEEVLELAALDHGRLSLSLQKLDLGDLVGAAVRLERMLAHQKRIHVEHFASGAVPVQADPGKLRQVLANLLSNAVKYSHAGSVVTVTCQAVGGRAVVEVRDRGVGIAAEDLSKLFRPFSRLRGQGTSGERSTGLGLAIAHRIVEGHGGQLQVASQPGQGSTFSVALPLAS